MSRHVIVTTAHGFELRATQLTFRDGPVGSVGLETRSTPRWDSLTDVGQSITLLREDDFPLTVRLET